MKTFRVVSSAVAVAAAMALLGVMLLPRGESLAAEAWSGRARARAAKGIAARQVRDRIAAVKRSREEKVSLSRSGQWRSGRRADVANAWQVRLDQSKSDGAIAGDIALAGSALFSRGRVAGRVVGDSVSGTVTSDRGAQLATFRGSVVGSLMSGTYTTSDGDSGTWSYDTARERDGQRKRSESPPRARAGLTDDKPLALR